MGKRSYEKLDIVTFGNHLLTTGDLDPLYIAIPEAYDGRYDDMKRFLIAYWCFYSAGFAAYASERKGADFWRTLMEAAKNETEAPIGGRWPRAKERRHFRGEACVKAVKTMWGQYFDNPERLYDDIVAPHDERPLPNEEAHPPLEYETLAARVQLLPLFGPWIAFKVADMVERCAGIPVNFSEAHVFMFKDPAQAAEMLWREHNGFSENTKPKDRGAMISSVVSHLEKAFAHHAAPPFRDRPVGLQEVETVLCKWKSHSRGHYPLNNDIEEIREGLEPWAEISDNARAVLHFMPTKVGA